MKVSAGLRPTRALFCKRGFLQKLLIMFVLAYLTTLVSFLFVDYFKDRTNYSAYDTIDL